MIQDYLHKTYCHIFVAILACFLRTCLGAKHDLQQRRIIQSVTVINIQSNEN